MSNVIWKMIRPSKVYTCELIAGSSALAANAACAAAKRATGTRNGEQLT
jgi:hypothetical protein